MKGYAMLKIGVTGWIEKEAPACGPCDAVCKPIAVAPCTSDIHTVWAGAIGERHNMILGHEAVGEVVEVGSLVKDFRPGDKVIVPAIMPGIISGFMMSITMSLEDYVITALVSGPGSTTLPLYVYSLIRFGVSPVINSLSFVLILIICIIAILLRSRLKTFAASR